MCIKLALLLAVCFAWALPVAAVTRYVDKDDGACTNAGTGLTTAPYCTIQAAADDVNPGDVVRIRNASTPYDEETVINRSGTAGNQIIFEPDAGHTPTLRRTLSGAFGQAMAVNDADYITIQGLTFDGAGTYTSAFAVRARSNTGSGSDVVGFQFLNNTIRNWGGTAAQASGQQLRAGLYLDGDASGAAQPSIRGALIQGNTFDGIRARAIQVSHANDTLITLNEFVNLKCGRDGDNAVNTVGIHIYDAAAFDSSGTVIRANTFHDFEVHDSQCGISNMVFDTSAGVWCDVGGAAGVVDGNHIYNIDPGDVSVGNHASVGVNVEFQCIGWIVKNNLIHDIGWEAIGQRTHSSNTPSDWPTTPNQYLNNTAFRIGGRMFGMGAGRFVAKNNILYGVNTQVLMSPSKVAGAPYYDIDYNRYYDSVAGNTRVGQMGADVSGAITGLASWQSTCGCDANSTYGDPLLVSTATPDLHLQPTSPVIGAGVNLTSLGVTTDVDGETRTIPFDMGADEVTAASTGIAVACYPFDGTAVDSTGLGHTGTLQNGATYGAGKVGQAVLLDGTNDYVSVASATDLNLTGDMSVDFWANLTSLTTDRVVLAKEDPGGTNNTPFYLDVKNPSTPRYHFYHHDGAGDFSSEFTFTGYTIPASTWHHVALTRSISPEQLALWVDGTLRQTLTNCDTCGAGTGWSDNPGSSTAALTIGTNPSLTAGTFFQGSLDELCLYNYVLTPAEIAARVARGNPSTPAPVIWRVTR